MKTGLVMEGGAMRGMFTAGVIDVFLENGITFDGAIGVSAGAAFGCNFKSNQIGRTIRYNLKYCRDKRYCSIWSLIFTGNLYGVKLCYHDIPNKLDLFDNETFNNNPMPFYVVCTDVSTGNPVYKKFQKSDDNFLEWVRASASLPLVSQVVEIDGMKLQDGGISDSIPLAYFEKIGYEKNVVILTQPKEYKKKKSSMMRLTRLLLKKYPNMVRALEKRHIMYNKQTSYVKLREEEGSALVFRPDIPLPIKRTEHNPEKLKAVYEMGRKQAIERLNEVKTFLNYNENKENHNG